MKLALKIDVDTYRGTREGVPRLVETLQRQGAGVRGCGVIQTVQPHQGIGPVGHTGGVTWLQHQGAFIANQSFLGPVALQQGGPVIIPGVDIIRAQRHRPLKNRQRLFHPLEAEQHHPQAVQDIGRIGPQHQGAFVVGQGLVQLALLLQGKTQIVLRGAIVRVQFHGAGQRGRGSLQVSQSAKSRPQVGVGGGDVRRKQRDAMAEADKIITAARTEASRLKLEAEKDLEFSIERRKQQALDRIAQSEAQALAQVRNTAIDVALTAAEKLIQSSLDPARKQALADKAITDLPARLN